MNDHQHVWAETGKQAKHVEGSLFKYGTPVVTYVLCVVCGQTGYTRPPSKIIYTWKLPEK